MRIVIALGGNALLKRDEPLTVDIQRANISHFAKALAKVAREHNLILTHGNGPQVGLLALQAVAYSETEAYPLDVIGAATAGMIGYMIEQELGNLLAYDVPIATILTRTVVDIDDPAFLDPNKFVGPVYNEQQVNKLKQEKGWTFKMDGDKWRRVVPSPMPRSIVWHRPIRWLLEKGTLLICAGGGGIPVMYKPGTQTLAGVEAVIDKDHASGLLARELPADIFVIATDVEGVYLDFGASSARLLHRTTPSEMEQIDFSAGSMGPKVEAACKFVQETGKRAIIGSMTSIEAIVEGRSGTIIEPDASGKTD